MTHCPSCGQAMPNDDPTRAKTCEIVDLWNRTAHHFKIPESRGYGQIGTKIRAMLREEKDPDVITRAFSLFAQQRFIQEKRYGLMNFLRNRATYLDRARSGEGGIRSQYTEERDLLGGSPSIEALNALREKYGMAAIA